MIPFPPPPRASPRLRASVAPLPPGRQREGRPGLRRGCDGVRGAHCRGAAGLPRDRGGPWRNFNERRREGEGEGSARTSRRIAFNCESWDGIFRPASPVRMPTCRRADAAKKGVRVKTRFSRRGGAGRGRRCSGHYFVARGRGPRSPGRGPLGRQALCWLRPPRRGSSLLARTSRLVRPHSSACLTLPHPSPRRGRLSRP